jgi:rhamnulose-1-phosphate aldolase/alcohol dehydrogenase
MDHLWREEEARGLQGVDLLVYRSHLIGRDPGLVLWGGGNTSLKQTETDFRGRTVRVMRIKGSGSDLRTIEPGQFPGLRLDDLEPLIERAAMPDDDMVAYLVHCLMEPGSPRPSIETLLHGFLPHPHIDHTHADAILALTNTGDGRRHVEAVFGTEAIWIPYRRPGFALSRQVAEAVRARPAARCVVLERHGLITWGDTARAAYDATIEMNNRAEEYARQGARGKAVFGRPVRPPLPAAERRRVAARLAPHLRGLLSGGAGPGSAGRDSVTARVILRFDDGEDILEFVGSEEGARLSRIGPATPDHLLYTRPRPLYVEPEGEAGLESGSGLEALKRAVAAGLASYRSWHEGYVRAHNPAGEPRLQPLPRVVLIPGLGMFTAWKDARHALMVGDIYHHTVRVMRAAQTIGAYHSLDPKDAYEVESWPLELYRMSLAPPERMLARRVGLVTGAAGGIGRAIARRLAEEGCHVVVADVDRQRAEAVTGEIVARQGRDRALAVAMDVTSERSVQEGFEAALVAYGGIDVVISNAGIAHSSPIDRMELCDWQRSLDVNATGHFLVAREAMHVLTEQRIGGGLVFVASKNVLAPGRDFGAYSASKAAECQLARILAIEGGEHGVRVNIINPDAIFQDSGLWSKEVREERARAHGIPVEELEDFYRRRNLLSVRVTAEDVAEAALWLASDLSSKTTGCILTTDGGVREAFPR